MSSDPAKSSGSPMPQQAKWYLRKEELKQRLKPEDIELLYGHSKRITLQKGEIFWFSDHPPSIYLLDQGLAGLCKTDDDGKKFVLMLYAPGEFFGQLIPDVEYAELEDYLEAIQEMRLIRIDPDAFHRVLAAYPDLLLRLVRNVETRNQFLQKRLSHLLFKDVAARTADFLLEICHKMGQACPYDATQIRDVRLTHQEIAEIVCAARPVVSAVLSELSKAGLINKHDRSLCLTNIETLKDIAEDGSKGLEELTGKR
jgi:CRP/FNR family transcriptional regulator